MKLSVSVCGQDAAVLDAYARVAALRPRSAAVQHAMGLLRHADWMARRATGRQHPITRLVDRQHMLSLKAQAVVAPRGAALGEAEITVEHLVGWAQRR